MSDWTVLIPADGETKPILVPDPAADLLAQARNLLGCQWIEHVRARALVLLGYGLLIDEEGGLTGKPVNGLATWLYGGGFFPLVGTAVITKTVQSPGGPDLAWLTEAEARDLHRMMTEATR